MVGRAWLLALAFTLIALVLALRLFQLQVLRGDRYARSIEEDRLVEEFIPARRGRILDRRGVPIVDNRAVYHLAAVISRLETDRRTRYATPFYALDLDQFDNLLSDLGTRRMPMPGEEESLRQIVLTELLRFPGVAVRRGRSLGDSKLGVIAISQAGFVPVGDGLVDEENRVLRVAADLGELVELGLLTDDPGLAVQREFLERRNQECVVLRDADLRRFIRQLGFRFDVPADFIRARLQPFTPTVTLAQDVPEEDDPEIGSTWTWHLLTEDGRSRAEESISRFFGIDLHQVRDAFGAQLAAHRRSEPSRDWYFVPASYADWIMDEVPEGLTMRPLELDGAPSAQERIFILQGDSPSEALDNRGMLSLFCRRLGAALSHPPYPPDELALLIQKHATERGARSLERQYRVHQLAFDPAVLKKFCIGLAEHLSLRGLERSAADIEASITLCRRRADRDWAGSTRNDPIIIERDVPQDIAVSLAGTGYLLRDLDPAIADDYVDVAPPFPGLRIVSDMGRDYPFDGHASLLTGWLKRLSAEYDRETALAFGLDPMGWTGDRQGLEYAYDKQLQGVVGKRQRLRVPGGYKDIVDGHRPAQAGRDLHTTIDMELQVRAEELLGNWFELAIELGTLPASGPLHEQIVRARQEWGHGRAGLVLMDCRSGAVLALASTPTFELSEIRQHYGELADKEIHPGQPLQDNATWPLKSPGSTVKPLVGLAAMLEGVYAPGQIITTPGHMGTWQGRYLLPDHSPYAPYQGGNDWEIEEALQESSNSFFATLAIRLGPERLADWYRRFGLGRENAVDIPWQRAGVMAEPANIDRIRPQEAWTRFDTMTMGIGQFISPCASPLQLVTIPACVANGGTILRPYLGQQAAGQAVAERLDLSPRILDALQRGMERVTDRAGTAPWLKLAAPYDHYKVAAKTGTSEWGTRAHPRPDNGWLIGYAPATNPEVAFAIFVFSAGTSGGRSCSAVAKKLLERYFELRDRDAAE